MSDLDLLGGDPAPGSADQIRSFAGTIAGDGRLAFEASQRCSQIGGTVAATCFEGAAAKAFATSWGEIQPDLTQMAQSYDAVASALSTYARRLEGLQREVQNALNRARVAAHKKEAAAAQRDMASARVRELTRQVGLLRNDELQKANLLSSAAPDDPTLPALHTQMVQASDLRRSGESQQAAAASARSSADGLAGEADKEIEGARRVAGSLRDERRQAEKECSGSIHDALSRSLKNKSNWNKVKGAIGDIADCFIHPQDHLLAIRAFLDKASAVLGVVALVLAATGVGGPIALIVAGLALAVAAVKLATTAYMMHEHIPGPDGKQLTWKNLATDTAMLGLSALGGLGALKAAKGLSLADDIGSMRAFATTAPKAMPRAAAVHLLKSWKVGPSMKRAINPVDARGATGLARRFAVAPKQIGIMQKVGVTLDSPNKIRLAHGAIAGFNGMRGAWKFPGTAININKAFFRDPKTVPTKIRVGPCYVTP